MNNRLGWLRALILFVCLILPACSGGGGSPTAPGIGDPALTGSRTVVSSPGSGHVCWGLWDISIDKATGAVDVVPLREAAFNANVTMFLQPPSSPMNLLSISMNPDTDFLIGYIDCDVTLQHPFKALAQFRGFDVRGIFLSDGSMAVESVAGLLRASPDEARVLNADGYTRWWNASEFGPEGTIFGYTMGAAGIQYYPTATVNPYKYFADELDAGADVSILDPANRGTFSTMKGFNTRNYIIQFSMDGPSPDFRFQYAIDANWDPPDPAFAPDYPIEAFNESAQMREAYHIRTWDDGSTAYYEGPGDFGGELRLAVEVFDWQTPSAGMSDQLSAIYMESTLLPVPIDVLPTAIEVPGSAATSRIYSVVIDDLMPTSAGEYEVLVVAESSAGTYEPNLEGGGAGWTYPDESLAAYHMMYVPVLDESPNDPPVAIADGTGPLSGYAPLTVTLDGTGSYDPNEPMDQIVAYDWDTDNDGVFEYEEETDDPIDHVYADPGIYEIQLRVTDSFGASDMLDVPIEVDVQEGSDEWPMGHYDAQNTGYNPNSHVAPPLQLVYQVNTTGHNYTQLVVGRGNIYMSASNGYIHCLSEQDGSQVWSQDIKTSGSFWVGCAPGLWNDHVIVGGTGVHSFNADTGSPDWHVYTTSFFDHQGLVIVDDTVYMRSTSSSYVSLDAASGSENWFIGWTTFPLMATAYGEVGGQGYCVAPYSYSERCVNADNGSTVWTQSCGGNAFGNVIVIGEYAYFGCTTLYRKHLATGTNAATYNLVNWQPVGSCTSDTDIFFVMRNTGNYTYKLMSFDFDLGFNWETTIGQNNNHPAYTDGYIWLTEGVGTSPQYMTAYDASDGSKAYTDSVVLNTYNPIWAGITNVNNRLYVTNNNGQLYCFESE